VGIGSRKTRSLNELLPKDIDAHLPTSEELHGPSRRQLAKKINEIIKVHSQQEVGVTTGLGCRTRWTNMESVSVVAPEGIPISKVTGNAANAQATSQNSAQNVS